MKRPKSRPSTRGCPGIEIEPGVYSGCHDLLCYICGGEGIVNWWRAVCHRCAGRGYVNDCPICDDGRGMTVRPADILGLPMIGHPSSIYTQSHYSRELQEYIAKAAGGEA